VLANSAINLGKNSVVQKYGTAILNAQQYAVFGTAVLNSFHSTFDNLPEVKQAGTIKSVIDLIGGSTSSTSPESVQRATQAIQQGMKDCHNHIRTRYI
jgi:methanogenic corrinoid protein MtbC1